MALVLLVGFGAGDAASAPVKAATPEEAFNAFKKATANKDTRTAMELLTPDLIDQSVEAMIGAGALLVILPAEARKNAPPIVGLLKKHGITEDDLKKANGQKDKAKYIKGLAAKVKDKVGLIIDITEAQVKRGKEPDKRKEPDEEARRELLAATLKDVKVEGDTATGKVVSRLKDRTGKFVEKVDTIRFKKIGGNWRIDITKD
jgi:hypothetical protein